jgi:hypothetical protein
MTVPKLGPISVVLTACLAPAAALAQDTRADEIADAQARKAQQVEPYVPGRAERLMLRIKEGLFDSPQGFYPWFESVYSGGGPTGGAGYRRFYGDRTFWDVRGLYSSKAYKLIELATDSLGHASDRIDVRAAAGWRDATEVSYFGLGNDTVPEAKSNFRLQQAYVAGGFRARGPGPFVFDFRGAYENFTLDDGRGGGSPSIERTYTADTAPGLGDSPAFAHMTWWGGVDTREPAPGYARRGGMYAIAYDAYLDMDDIYTFDRVKVEAVQHVPILRENWVVSLRGAAVTTIEDDATVPYFLMPALGSGSTLRAYPSWRFRDRHSLLFSGEFRWIPSRLFLDMALFYDAGKVTASRDDLNFSDLQDDIGIGVRFHTPASTPLRIELAHGDEGFNLVFSGAAPF